MARQSSPMHVMKAIAQGRFTYLLAFMFLLMLVFPFLEEHIYGPPVLQLLYAFLLISALYAVAENRWVFRCGILLLAASLAAHWWLVLAPSPISAVAAFVIEIIFFAFVVGTLLFHVFGHEQVTADTIAGAICAFLLLGFMWALAYQTIHFFDPGAFANVATEPLSPALVVDLVYYSFATLTTLGYGDILPISSVGRMLAVTEASAGQIYLTVLVARLVGLYAPARAARADS